MAPSGLWHQGRKIQPGRRLGLIPAALGAAGTQQPGSHLELLRPADSQAVPQTHGISICNISGRLIRRPEGDSLQLDKAYLLDVPSSGRPWGTVGHM